MREIVFFKTVFSKDLGHFSRYTKIGRVILKYSQ